MTQELQLTPEHVELLMKALPTMGEAQKRKTLELLRNYKKLKVESDGKENFLDFVEHDS